MRRFCLVASATAGLVAAQTAFAQCGFINFEDFAPGTPVTNNYPGITFSGRVTGGGLAANPLIFNAGANTSSPTRCLSPRGDGIDEFSCDYLRMDFAMEQQLVTFAVGVRFGCTPNDTCRIRWYSTSGALLGFRDVRVNGAGTNVCNTYVRVGSPTGPRNIARIEVEYGVSPGCACAYELIDDIAYDTDATPPEASFGPPADRGCVCANTTVQVRGTANDTDGTYVGDRLEYARTSDGPWTLVGTASSPAPGPDDLLYSWNTAGLSGWYHLRLTVTNSCGLTDKFENVVYVDALPPTINLRTPVAAQVFGGQVCFDGTVTDDCSISSYTVSYRPAGGGAFNPVNPATPVYAGGVINDPIAQWQTASGAAAVPDGAYTVRIDANDGCLLTSTLSRNIVIDNTAPVSIISSPTNCSRTDQGIIQVRGTASDANMSGWALQYTGGDAHGWVTIATGTSNIVNGVLANWDARSLRDCCYVLRLIVTDSANVSCTGSGNRSEYTVAFDLGTACTQDYNGDGRVNSQDYFDFLTVFFGGCP